MPQPELTPQERPRSRLQTYATPDFTVTFAPERCIHAAVCVRELPPVFAPRERPWIRPERGDGRAIADVVAHCPTGALRFAWRERPGPSPLPVERAGNDAVVIQLRRAGPLYLSGAVRIEHEDGGTIAEEEGRIALCRCGRTANAPFCDGSHVRVPDFETAAPAPHAPLSDGDSLRPADDRARDDDRLA